ncbi:hypothetical protein J6Z48_03200 [bacterium]|nr:hypothetical protein [bacterium]
MKLPCKKLNIFLINSLFITGYLLVLLFAQGNYDVHADDSSGSISLKDECAAVPLSQAKNGLYIDVVVNNASCSSLKFKVEMEIEPQSETYLAIDKGFNEAYKKDTFKYDDQSKISFSNNAKTMYVELSNKSCGGDKVQGTAMTFKIQPFTSDDKNNPIQKSEIKIRLSSESPDVVPVNEEYVYYIGRNRCVKPTVSSWFMTKGFEAYSSGGVSNSVPDYLSEAQDGLYRIDGKPTIERYNLIGNAEKSKIDTFTGFLGMNTTSPLLSNNSKFAKNGSSLAEYIEDENNKKNYYYDYLITQLSRKSSFVNKVKTLNDISTCKRNCYFRSNDTIEIGANFECNKNAILIASEEDIIINPDVITKQSTEDDPEGGNGCIFLARRNIIIKGGSKKSSGSVVGYDYVNGFLVADGQIIIQEDSEGDGLEIIGGLAAFGSNSNDSAIVINRKLSSNNSTNPSFVVVYDPRYSKISSKFFGLVSYVYETQDGAKL